MSKLNERPSERSIFIWNFTGNIANALLSVVVLMIVARILNDEQADIFSVAWTISQLMATVGTFQIRTYQATDVKGTFSFRQYYVFRVVTVAVMMVISYAYVVVRGYTGKKALVVFLVCLFRAVDSFADVYEGWFQQKERLDLAGKALSCRIVVAVVGFLIGLVLTKSLVFSCLILVMSYVICLVLCDIRYNKSVDVLQENVGKANEGNWIIKLMAEGAPLFINAFLLISIMNEPKMVLDTAIEEGYLKNGIQTVYNILFMPASCLNLAFIVFRPLITKMAIVWNEGKTREYLKILVRICLYLFGIGAVLLVGSIIGGIPILSVMYAIDLTDYKTHLLIIILGGCIYTFAAILDNALVVIRKQYVLVIAYALSFVYIKIIAKYMIEHWGIMGGAISYASSMCVFLCITLIIFCFCFYRANKRREVL